MDLTERISELTSKGLSPEQAILMVQEQEMTKQITVTEQEKTKREQEKTKQMAEQEI